MTYSENVFLVNILGYDQPRVSVDGSPLPNTRKIRTTLLPNYEYPAKDLNAIFYAFGQYSSHDATEHRPLQTTGDFENIDYLPVFKLKWETTWIIYVHALLLDQHLSKACADS